MKRTRLRSVSKKTAIRQRDCSDLRRELVLRVGKCEMCGHDPSRPKFGTVARKLDCHEIANGPNRLKCLDKLYGLLVLCWPCNSQEATDKTKWPSARQLALLLARRPEDYNLSAYLTAFHPSALQAVTQAEVDAYLETLS